jgi:hypothetical protein
MKELATIIANKWAPEHRDRVEKMVLEAVDEYIQKNADACSSCGASTKKYTHNLSEGLVHSLKKFVYVLKKERKLTANIVSGVGFTVNEANNFQKLAYFGLVGKAKNKGEWYLTKKGLNFLQGHDNAPKQVTTFRSKVVDRSVELAHIRDYGGPIEWQKDFTASDTDTHE